MSWLWALIAESAAKYWAILASAVVGLVTLLVYGMKTRAEGKRVGLSQANREAHARNERVRKDVTAIIGNPNNDFRLSERKDPRK